MRLSNETIKILKNYAAINNSLLFSKGNVLKTVSGEKTILATAMIQEEIPFDFAIYDLSSMLAMLSCLNDPEIICHSKKVEIKSSQGQQGSFDIYYSDASLIATPPRSEEHTSELQSHHDLVCRLLLEKKKIPHKKKKIKKKKKKRQRRKRHKKNE